MGLTVLVVANPAAKHLKALANVPDDVHLIVSNDPDELRARAPEADLLLNTEMRGDLLALALKHAGKARWIHSLYTGVEGVLIPDVVASPLPLSNGKAVFGTPLAEWAIGAMIYFNYQTLRLLRQQQARNWEPFDIETLEGRTLGIIGYGGLGRATAQRAKALGMRTLVMRRSQHAGADPLIDQSYTPAQINELMAASDFVCVAAPLTKETRGMVGEAQIAAMKPNAVLINIGRGPIIDEPALIRALQANKIRGAALDVFTTEPLPADSPLWSMDNVLLSPHSADHVPDFLNLAYEAFFANLERFRKGEPLENIVDKHAGY